MNTCVRRAYAKINLGLDVLGRRPDGYHELRTVMQTVDIWDELTLTKTDAGIAITTDAGELPTDGDNLIHKAIKLMQEEYGFDGGVRVHLRKNIPIAAGMAGGSTDAAATLKGVNELYELGVSEKRLMELGVRIGADVPYCVAGGTVLAEGIGERLTRLPAAPECVLVVAKPVYNISTKEIYEKLDARTDYPHPDMDGLLAAIREGSLSGMAARLGNVLEAVTIEQCPMVSRIRETILAGGALGCLMSGSGPSVFGIFADREKAEETARALRKLPDLTQIFVTKFL
ncbi:MAG: 4-(cytidine 5'-diphospho)-2-C-methyl-D-erythritol kinase [Clostridium sp.]|nr:4-(cytidine 5'-diphospho)-2-C-methyl-D-erythritol kinase [Acetatifactor muris]MCM1564296.1 4-(cytidine 5'-diphospho)-2-C-methyl-D-erythritol kinase [Clostridium sp.]